ncbi:P-loop NTPase fold protein [Pontibacterium sp.]|uniref:KAP family P-loop NTPase fold protein n=1 Tax=Pontibacterium sp. TaxID=2036026 RepID=UPI0035191482
MPDSSINPNSAASLVLRLKEPLFTEGEWPCATDLLGRHSEIENLSPVLLNAQAPLVFAIDAPWGGGKTTFIRLWQHYLQQQEQVCLYLNAWESDFADDPLLPMLSTLDEWLREQQDDSTPKKAWNKAKEYAPGVLKSTAVAAAKVATFGALDVEKEYEKIAADLAGGAIEGVVDSFNVQKLALEQFKIQLSAALDALPEGQQNLLVFVDELDRCKPTYAIELLERIKHLFDIERLVFVLAVNRDQLSKSLQGVYGPSFNGLHYLKRFIDLDYQLKVPDKASYIQAVLKQPDMLAYFQSRSRDSNLVRTISDLLDWLTNRFDYSLRDIDQLVMRLRLIVRAIPSNQEMDVPLLVCLLVLRQENGKLYQQFVDDITYVNEVIDFLLGDKFESSRLPKPFAKVAGWLIQSGYDAYEDLDLEPVIEPWQQRYDQMEDDDERKSDLSSLLRIARHNDGGWNRSGVRKLAYSRIELVSQITI